MPHPTNDELEKFANKVLDREAVYPPDPFRELLAEEYKRQEKERYAWNEKVRMKNMTKGKRL
jgi:hypothetical protein